MSFKVEQRGPLTTSHLSVSPSQMGDGKEMVADFSGEFFPIENGGFNGIITRKYWKIQQNHQTSHDGCFSHVRILWRVIPVVKHSNKEHQKNMVDVGNKSTYDWAVPRGLAATRADATAEKMEKKDGTQKS